MKRLLIALSGIFVFFLFSAVAMAQTNTTFYVSPKGDNNNPGTEAKPFATIDRARDAVRELKKSGPLAKPVSVILLGGTYNLKEALVLTPEDSGTETCPVTYSSADREIAVVSGGKTITGWKKGKKGLWTVSLPEVASGGWYFTSLFVNGISCPRPRLPEEDYYTIADFENKKNRPLGGQIEKLHIRRRGY